MLLLVGHLSFDDPGPPWAMDRPGPRAEPPDLDALLEVVELGDRARVEAAELDGTRALEGTLALEDVLGTEAWLLEPRDLPDALALGVRARWASSPERADPRQWLQIEGVLTIDLERLLGRPAWAVLPTPRAEKERSRLCLALVSTSEPTGSALLAGRREARLSALECLGRQP